MTRLALLVGLVTVAAGCGGGGTTTVTVARTVTHTVTRTVTAAATSTGATQAAPCTASSLTGSFSVVPGSAGAGQIGYRLRLANTGPGACSVAGVPTVELVGAAGNALPTNASPAQPGKAAAPVVLERGEAAVSDARFSPDVPGGSEPTDAPCEPKAHTLRITIGGGRVDVPAGVFQDAGD